MCIIHTNQRRLTFEINSTYGILMWTYTIMNKYDLMINLHATNSVWFWIVDWFAIGNDNYNLLHRYAVNIERPVVSERYSSTDISYIRCPSLCQSLNALWNRNVKYGSCWIVDTALRTKHLRSLRESNQRLLAYAVVIVSNFFIIDLNIGHN